MIENAILIDKLKNKGYKLTRQRQAILEAFAAYNSPLMTPGQLFHQVIIKLPGTNFSTVYRNLEMLVQEGILNKVMVGSKAQAYEMNFEAEHHHHMICKTCGYVQCIDFCPVEDISDKHGFEPTEHRLEIYGFCGECRKLRRDKG